MIQGRLLIDTLGYITVFMNKDICNKALFSSFYREGSIVTILANLAFGILTVLHLMYLGVMFDQGELQEEGYRWTHTIDKWKSLGFFSHYFMGFAFVLNFFL